MTPGVRSVPPTCAQWWAGRIPPGFEVAGSVAGARGEDWFEPGGDSVPRAGVDGFEPAGDLSSAILGRISRYYEEYEIGELGKGGETEHLGDGRWVGARYFLKMGRGPQAMPCVG